MWKDYQDQRGECISRLLYYNWTQTCFWLPYNNRAHSYSWLSPFTIVPCLWLKSLRKTLGEGYPDQLRDPDFRWIKCDFICWLAPPLPPAHKLPLFRCWYCLSNHLKEYWMLQTIPGEATYRSRHSGTVISNSKIKTTGLCCRREHTLFLEERDHYLWEVWKLV